MIPADGCDELEIDQVEFVLVVEKEAVFSTIVSAYDTLVGRIGKEFLLVTVTKRGREELMHYSIINRERDIRAWLLANFLIIYIKREQITCDSLV